MMQEKKKNLSLQFVFLVIAFLFTWIILGSENLNIFNINWSLYDDATTDYLTWIYFKNDIWRFPIVGTIPNFGLNGNSTIAISGTIPFLALIFKPLKYIINDNFNYFGFWIFLCFFLQSYVSFLLLKKITKDETYSFIGSIFFSLSPIFFNKIGYHYALAGHWIIILSFYFYCYENLNKKFSYNIFLICFSTLVHFYFTMMLSIIYFIIVFFNIIEKKNLLFHLKKVFLLVIIILPIMYTVGYFAIPMQDTLGYGYGFYKLNILGPIDPVGGNLNGNILWSRFISDIPNATAGEFEGFNYLGLGQLLLIIFGIYYFFKNIKKSKTRKIFPYFMIILIMFLLSITHKVDFGTFNVISLDLNKYVLAGLSWMRASGRFFWPIYYFLIFFSIFIISQNFQKNKRILFLAILLCIQIIDISPGLKKYLFGNSFNKKEYKLEDPIWSKLSNDYEVVSSTYIKNGSNDFFKIIGFLNDYTPKTEIAYLARFDRGKLIENRYNNYKNLYANKINSRKFYVINNYGHLNHLKFLTKNSKHAILKRNDIWLLLPDKSELMNEKDFFNLNKIEMKKLNLNDKINFTYNSLNENLSIFGLGWTYDLSTNGIWTDGKDSTILFNVETLSDEIYFIELEIMPNLLKPDQTIELLISGQGISKKKIKFNNLNNFKNKIIIKFDKKKIINEKYLLLNLNVSGAVSALEVRKSPDVRKLGLKIDSLTITN